MEMVQFAPGVMIAPPRFRGQILPYLLYSQLDEGSLLNKNGSGLW